MGVPRALRLAAILAVLCAPAAAFGADTLRVMQFDTHSSVHIARFAFGSLTWGTTTHTLSTSAAKYTCVSFGNVDERPVSEVRFHFADYDGLGALVHEDDLVRTGTFTQNVIIEGINAETQKFNEEDCVLNPERLARGGLIVVFVKSLKFGDGAVWNTAGPAIPEHLGADPPASAQTPKPTPS
jgi:hypothetical protein